MGYANVEKKKGSFLTVTADSTRPTTRERGRRETAAASPATTDGLIDLPTYLPTDLATDHTYLTLPTGTLPLSFLRTAVPVWQVLCSPR